MAGGSNTRSPFSFPRATTLSRAAFGSPLNGSSKYNTGMNPHHDLLRTVAFAARAHQGQLRKDGKTPYVSHVVRVAFVVRNVFGFDDPRMLQAALLHDTIEDTKTDFDDIAGEFSTEVAEWVAL